MFERGPFRNCPQCGEKALGILRISLDHYDRRCGNCKAKRTFFLPEIDKKVLYLDQFAVSEIFKVKEGKRRASAPHTEFWTEAAELLDHAIRLQRIICPASSIHRSESIVYRDGNALQFAHEMLGGETSFEDAITIEHRQIFHYFECYLQGQEPTPFRFDVDEILRGHRNGWLPDLHVHVNADWSVFAENTRLARDKAAEEFASLYETWAREKPSFQTVLNNELGSLAHGYVSAYAHFVEEARAGAESGDIHKYMDGALSPVVSLIHQLNHEFINRGMSPQAALVETAKFLNWPKNQSLPHHWISAHLFAAIAERISLGQKRMPNRGMMNDVKAISLYGPYVDALFLDNECASLLEQKAVVKGVALKAKIFCLRRSTEFLQYLRELVDSTPHDVVDAAQELYGRG